MRFSAVLVVVLSLFTSSFAFAVGKLPSDPNRTKRSARLGPDSQDKRLDIKITYQARARQLRLVLEDFSKLSGTTFKCGTSSGDWQVRDRRVNIFAKDVPLKDLMTSIARVTRFSWGREEKDGSLPAYRLFMSKKTAKEAEKLRKTEVAKLEKWVKDTRKRIVDDLLNMENISDEEMAKLRESNISLYAGEATLQMMRPLSALINRNQLIKRALIEGGNVTLQATDLTPEQQQFLLSSCMRMPWWADNLGGTPEDLRYITISVETPEFDFNENPYRPSILGNILFKFENSEYSASNSVALEDPENPQVKLENLRMLQDNQYQSDEQMEKDELQVFLAEQKRDDTAEPLIEHPDDPDLQKAVKFEPEHTYKLSEVLEALAKASGMAVVSDSFGADTSGMIVSACDKIKLQTLIDTIGTAFTRNWHKYAGIIEFHDRKWFRKVTGLISDEWVNDWRSILVKTGTLDLDSLSQIATLNHLQEEMNLYNDEVFQNSFGLLPEIAINRDLLKLYASLSAAERADIFSQSGLDLRFVLHRHRNLVENLLENRGKADIINNPDTPLILYGSSKANGKAIDYEFKLLTTSKEPLLDWDLSTPRYNAPPKR